MATQLFFREDSVDLGCRGESDALRAGGASGWYFGSLLTTRGASATTRTRNTVTGPTNGIEYPGGGGGTPGEYVSPPLDQAVTISGTITLNLWASENNMSANVAINCLIQRLNSQLQVVSTIATTARTTEVAVTTPGVNNFTVAPTSTNMQKGDRIRVVVFADDAGTMATGFTTSFVRSGPTAGVSGDSYVTFTETFGFLTTAPTGTQIWATETASDVTIGGTELVMWSPPGSNSVQATTNTRAGHAAKAQCTLTAGGALVDWYTPKLNAFTLSDLIIATIHAWNPGANNALVGVEIAVCNSDGSSPVVYGYGTIEGSGEGELGTGEAAYTCRIAGVDTAVADQQRLRIRVYLDDTALAQTSGGTVIFGYGSQSGASGDFNVILTQNVTEFVPTTPGPVWRYKKPHRFATLR